jgi:hypothetical protein
VVGRGNDHYTWQGRQAGRQPGMSYAADIAVNCDNESMTIIIWYLCNDPDFFPLN